MQQLWVRWPLQPLWYVIGKCLLRPQHSLAGMRGRVLWKSAIDIPSGPQLLCSPQSAVNRLVDTPASTKQLAIIVGSSFWRGDSSRPMMATGDIPCPSTMGPSGNLAEFALGKSPFFHRFFSNCFFGELSIADGWFTFLVPHMFGIQQKFSVLGCMVLCSTSVDKCGASEKTVPFSSVKWWYYQLSISMCLCYYPNLCRQFGTPLLVSILILWVHNLWAMVRLPLNS